MTPMRFDTSSEWPLGRLLKLSLRHLALAAVIGLAGCASSDPVRQPPAARPQPRLEVTARADVPHGELAARLARQMVGKPYRYGGSSPETGFDCSGLVFYSYTQSGAEVPRTSLDQFRAARKISLADAQPGDVVFFQDQEKLSHVGMYVGNGQFVHAPSSGKRVSLAHIDLPYYREHLVAVGRLTRN